MMSIQDKTEYLKQEVKNTLHLDLTSEQAEMMVQYYLMMIEKNKVMNLTRVTDFEEAVQKHFVDSLSIGLLQDVSLQKNRILDLGCGAGFPGIPLKIMWPDNELHLLDSVGKKVNFVNDVIRELGLKNAVAMHARAEDLARDPSYREKYDLVISRAVANMATLSEYCMPFVKMKGHFIAYKSGDSTEEIKQAEKIIHLTGGTNPELNAIELYDMGRILVQVEKSAKTPSKFPRKAGMPSRMPII